MYTYVTVLQHPAPKVDLPTSALKELKIIMEAIRSRLSKNTI